MELFKFYSFNWFLNKDGDRESYFIDSLANNYIYFSDMNELNDPFEKKINLIFEIVREEKELEVKKKYFVSFLKEAYAKKGGLTEKLKKEIKDINESTIDEFNDVIADFCNLYINVMNHGNDLRYRTCCFTKRCDSLLMWGHYGDGMRGVCLKFNFSQNSVHLLSVKYADEVQSFSIWEHIENKNDYIYDLHSTKSSVWSYEEEVRMVQTGDVVYGRYEPAALDEIIFGCKIEADNVSEVFKSIKNIKNNVEYKVAVPDSRGYGVCFVSCKDEVEVLENIKKYQNSNNLIHKVIVK